MKFWALIPATVFLVTKVNAIALDVREVPGSDWIYTTVQDGVCHNFDNPIIQYYLDPGSNGGKSFLCRIFK
ncbi:hypothetical protein BJX68DRAFT_266621 [Aspergillus pseudodeflectus]|uniref:Uncharacterized protein n=1 Tax=Aspergillus pseudodeflectus TaxID=176178 RepID=A0ABR4KDS0_9EURO